MTAAAPASTTTGSGRFTPALLILFVGSGCAALIYEVVWFHLLRLYVGSSAISLGFLLGSFMAGMGLGSILLPRLLSASRHPLRVYACLELSIGVFGLAMPSILPILGEFYTGRGGNGIGGFALRGLVCAAALLPPTLLMGATLPAIARWMDTTRRGIQSMGWFYGANIAGAVLGTLLAGFYLLRVHDIMVATWVAAVINAVIAVVALILAGRESFAARQPAAEPPPVRGRRLVYLAIALSGFTALAAEVVWTRLLSLLFGASVYTFSLILAVFLVGLGIGSAIGSRLAARVERPRVAFGICQLLLLPSIAYTAMMISAVVPWGEPTYVFQPVVYEILPLRYAYDFVRCALAVLPAPLLWGASFPLALASVGIGQRDPGRLVGGIYAANTLGAIGGALAVSLALIGLLGTKLTQQVMVGLAGLTACLLLASSAAEAAGGAFGRLRAARIVLVMLLVTPLMSLLVMRVPNDLIAYGRVVTDWGPGIEYRHVSEGVNASVAVSDADGIRSFHVSGKVVASTGETDMRLQRMLGHLPALLHADPKSALIVGCGAGVTAGCFVDYPGIERIVICEIEPEVPKAAREFLATENCNVLKDPRTELVLDDARHFLATTDETFDIITSDPIHPWVRGAAALYSAEYYDLVKARLNPGGIVTQWVPLYETDEPSVKSQVGTFFDAFPYGTLWNSDPEEVGYDVVMLAQVAPTLIDVDAIEDRVFSHPKVFRHLTEVDLGNAVLLLRTYCGRAQDLVGWLADRQLNTDRTLRLQYLAGLALDMFVDEEIYAAIKSHYRFPEGLFVASPALDRVLRDALDK